MAETPVIAVGYDGSDESRLAVDWASARAEKVAASLEIVRAVGSELVVGVLERHPDAVRVPAQEKSSIPCVARAVERLGADRVHLTKAVGNPAGRLIEAARSACTVVVGSRGRGAIMAGLFGSTSYAVAAHAPCPVVVVQAPDGAEEAPVPDATHPVVVGVDALDVARGVLDAAAEVAQSYGASLRLVRATLTPPYAMSVPGGGWASPALMADFEEQEAGLIGECADYVRERFTGIDVATVHSWGDPASVIVEHSADAGLIVLGPRGHGGFAGLLLGSVSHSVIHSASVPVLIER